MESVAIDVADLLREPSMPRKIGALPSGARLAALFSSSRSLAELVVRDGRIETDKRHSGLMILRRRLGRIIGDVREDESVPVFSRPWCRPCACASACTRNVHARSVMRA